ncbi:unnamed protein product [Rhizophagus irregularis]|nr:unnamed protein product [Rhizophagus irregularis]
MSNMGDMSRINPNKPEGFLRFISENRDHFLFENTEFLGSFIENGFLKQIYDKSPQAMDKAQLLVNMFGECANPKNFSEQSKATNIQPTTLSLIFSIAIYISSMSWDNFATRAYQVYGDMGDNTESEGPSDNDELFTSTSSSYSKTTPNPVDDTPPVLPDVEMTPVDQTVIPENSRKKDKQKARVTDDKQVKNQSTTAKPDTKTPVKNPNKDKKSSPEATQILTGYEAVGEEQERIRDIIVYDIPYTWDLQKILAELKLWGNTIKCSVKRQHKYQTLRVKIALSSFALPQFKNFWTTDLGGIPVRWFPASWTLREMTMATLWSNRKPCEFLVLSGAHASKIIQTSKGRRKLVAYFANWETTLMTLEAPPVTLPSGKELKWCRHSIPNLKKAQPKPKTKKTPEQEKIW